MWKSALLALLAVLTPLVPAARLILRDGSVVNGDFISGTAETIVFQDGNGVRRRFETGQVRNIEFESAPAGAQRGRNPGIVVPAGGLVVLRVEGDIMRQYMAAGRTWTAVIVQDVVDESGKVAIPASSAATLIVRRTAAGTTLTVASYVLDLDSVRLGLHRYVAEPSEGGLGRLIAASPAPVMPVLTSGPEIRVPAQTVLRFRLETARSLAEAMEPGP